MAKLMQLLFARFQAGGQKLTVMPAELIARNGETLRARVLELSAPLSADFAGWASENVVFANSLVDRIVSEPLEPAGAVAATPGLAPDAGGCPPAADSWRRPAVSVCSRCTGGWLCGVAIAKLRGKMTPGSDSEAAQIRKLRGVVVSLGPFFIKLGQALSIRPDILSPQAMVQLAFLTANSWAAAWSRRGANSGRYYCLFRPSDASMPLRVQRL